MLDRNALLEYVLDQYGTEPEYLWDKWPDYAVLRQPSGKWYGIIMNVAPAKLGLDPEFWTSVGRPVPLYVDILDVKCDPLASDLYHDTPGVLPGYHMNKIHWLTLLLDGTVPDDLIRDLLHESYRSTAG